jgi:hypothetical protein
MNTMQTNTQVKQILYIHIPKLFTLHYHTHYYYYFNYLSCLNYNCLDF